MSNPLFGIWHGLSSREKRKSGHSNFPTGKKSFLLLSSKVGSVCRRRRGKILEGIGAVGGPNSVGGYLKKVLRNAYILDSVSLLQDDRFHCFCREISKPIMAEKSKCTETANKDGTWLREISSCCCLTTAGNTRQLLLNKIYISFLPSL